MADSIVVTKNGDWTITQNSEGEAAERPDWFCNIQLDSYRLGVFRTTIDRVLRVVDQIIEDRNIRSILCDAISKLSVEAKVIDDIWNYIVFVDQSTTLSSPKFWRATENGGAVDNIVDAHLSSCSFDDDLYQLIKLVFDDRQGTYWLPQRVRVTVDKFHNFTTLYEMMQEDRRRRALAKLSDEDREALAL